MGFNNFDDFPEKRPNFTHFNQYLGKSEPKFFTNWIRPNKFRPALVLSRTMRGAGGTKRQSTEGLRFWWGGAVAPPSISL